MNEDGDVNLSARHLCSSIIPLSLSLSLSSRGAPRVARVLYRKPPIKHGSGGGSGSGGDCSGA